MILGMLVCPRCATENPGSAKFCNECGAPLVSEGRAERRVVSVVFVDVVGFTSRSEELDVEDVEQFLSRYHRVVRRELERHGGTVEKFIGDAVMALFGAPVVREDDAVRAVHSGLAIQKAVGGLRERDEVDIHVRVGVTTGEALVALGARPDIGEGMAFGDVVNTAARLQSAASVDGVLVDESTYRVTSRFVGYADSVLVMAKGKARPVPGWPAIEAASALPGSVSNDDAALVGRDEELGQLAAVLDRSRREPSTQVVTLVGQPGIGKSRLVRAVVSQVDESRYVLRWLWGRSPAYGEGIAFWALGEMVKAEAGVLESDSAEVAVERLNQAVRVVVEGERNREWVGRQLRPLLGLEGGVRVSGEGGRVDAFAAWRRFFEALATKRPTILVFEDMHWGDDAVLDFVELLADHAGAVPLAIVCTARPELLEWRPSWGQGKLNMATISLVALSAHATARFVTELLGSTPVPADVQRALVLPAEGNPLYAQEYVRMLRDRGFLASDGEAWRLVGEPKGLPASVYGIIAARLDALSDDEKRFVHDAAVIGRTVRLAAVCALSGRDPDQAEQLVRAIEPKQLLRRSRPSSVAGEVELTFAHALIQDVAYSQLPRAERAQKHERVAAWIEQFERTRDDVAELLAYHYQTALRLHDEVGTDTSEISDRARIALVAAGRQADAVNGYAAAARHYAAAADLMSPEDPDQPTIVFAHAQASFRADQPDAADVLEAAFKLQVAAEDWSSAAEAAQLLGDWYKEHSGDLGPADRWWTEAERYASQSGNFGVLGRVAEGRANRLWAQHRYAEATALAKRAKEQARRAGDWEGFGLLTARYGLGQVWSGDRSGIDRITEAADVLAEHES